MALHTVREHKDEELVWCKWCCTLCANSLTRKVVSWELRACSKEKDHSVHCSIRIRVINYGKCIGTAGSDEETFAPFHLDFPVLTFRVHRFAYCVHSVTINDGRTIRNLINIE